MRDLFHAERALDQTVKKMTDAARARKYGQKHTEALEGALDSLKGLAKLVEGIEDRISDLHQALMKG